MPDLADDQVGIPNGPTPQTHLVSHIDGVIPKSVTATFDGTGAAKFLPVLIIAGKEGREVARIPAPEVAAGATAEVSWFPRGLKQEAAPQPTGVSPVVAVATATPATLTAVPAGGTELVTFEVAGSSDPSKAYWSSSQGTPGAATPPRIWLHFKAPAKGTVWVQMSCTWPTGKKIDARIHDPDAYALPHDGWDSFSGYDFAAITADGPQLMDSTYLVFNLANADVPIAVRLTNNDAAPSTPELVQLCAIYWPDLYVLGS